MVLSKDHIWWPTYSIYETLQILVAMHIVKAKVSWEKVCFAIFTFFSGMDDLPLETIPLSAATFSGKQPTVHTSELVQAARGGFDPRTGTRSEERSEARQRSSELEHAA